MDKNQEADCLFCKIISQEVPAEIVWSNDNWLAFLDIHPINPGHTLLVPKSHFKNFFTLPENLLSEIGPLASNLGQTITKAVKADGFNLGINNDPAAGQIIFHTHIHLMPRFDNDNHKHWSGQEQTPEELQQTAKLIKQHLS
ncbi:MAG: HIT family protein [Patescibacteria group bacterium]